MKALVIGAGLMGSAITYDLAHSEEVEKVLLADIDIGKAKNVTKWIGLNAEAVKLDVYNYDEVIELMKLVDVVCGATSYNHNLLLTKAAIDCGKHFCDLGGNMDVVYKQMELDEKAKEANVLIVPNCGLAPGLATILGASGSKLFEVVDAIHLRVGGLPQNPKPPLNYQLVFSAEGLINEYIEPAEVIQNGNIRQVPSMDDIEEIEFPPPFGKLEAFNTSGGVSTLPKMFQGKIKELDYKTIRYKGHCEKFKTLLDLGFASTETIVIGNSIHTAREFFEELLKKKLSSSDPDLVLMRVWIRGLKNNKNQTLVYEMTDYFDEKTGISAMMRTTSYPTSIIAQMIVKGIIKERGVIPPEQFVPVQSLIRELKRRNISISEKLL